MSKNNFIIDLSFLKICKDENLTIDELSILLYFYNSFDNTFDISKISNILNIKEEDILLTINSLVNKKLIDIKTEENEFNKKIEVINLDKLSQKIKTNKTKSQTVKKESNIYSKFESEFGRTLSPMDYEVIKAWLDKPFNEELILHALKEASYNGVKSLRYIDRILFEWSKSGIKNIEDITKTKKEDTTMYNTEIINFNWLDNNE